MNCESLGQKQNKSGNVSASAAQKSFNNLSMCNRKYVQQFLRGQGLYSGSIDGLWGGGTTSGLEKAGKKGKLKGLTSSKIITSNQNNDLFILDKSTGNLIKQIPTEETLINNLFTNNIALSNNQIYFLNTFGSLYSINILNNKINWFINLNKSLDLNLTNLFNGNKLVYHNNKIIVSSNENFFIIDSKNGSIIDKKNFSSLYQPLLINNYLFLVTKNNLLVAMKLDNGEIIYSYDIADKVAKFINSNKKELRIKNIILVNNEIYVFLRNSFILKFDLKGEINEIYKLSYSLLSYPIFVNNLLFFLDKKKRLIAIN